MGKKINKFKDVMGKVGHGIAKVGSGINFVINPWCYERDEDSFLSIAQGVTYSVAAFWLFIGVVSSPFWADEIAGNVEKDNLLKNVEVLNNDFNASVEEKAGLNNFYSANCKLYKDNDEDILSVFGSQDVKHKNGNITKEFVEVKFVLENESAKNLEKAMKEKAEYDRYTIDVASNFGSSSTLNTEIDYSIFSRDAQKKAFRLSTATYNALNEAVAKAYECEVNSRYEASSMNRSLANAYRFTKPESLTTSEVHGPFVHSHKEFYSAGLITTGVSDITRDFENDTATFYVDTLQTVDGRNYTMNKAEIVVKGAELSDDEVFKAFVDGKYDSFTEIERFGLTENSTVTAELCDKEIYD